MSTRARHQKWLRRAWRPGSKSRRRLKRFEREFWRGAPDLRDPRPLSVRYLHRGRTR